MSRLLQTSLFSSSDEGEEEPLRVLVPSTSSPASLPPRTSGGAYGHTDTAAAETALQTDDDNEPPPISLVRDSSPDPLVHVPETTAKLQRLQDVFGASKSIAVLQRSLKLAKGSVNDAIAIAVTMDDEEDGVEDEDIIGILKTSPSLTAFNTPATKRRRLVKKKDLKPAVPIVESSVVVHVILKDADLQVLSVTAPPPPIYVIPSSPIQTYQIKSTSMKHQDEDSLEVKDKVLQDSDEDEAASTDSETEDYSDDKGSLNKATVDYFNACTPDQLIDLTSCTEDQANSIISLRPFTNLKQLRAMLETGGTISGKKIKKLVGVLDRYTETMEGYAQVDALIDKVRSHGASLNAVLSKWGLSVNARDGKGELCMTELPQRPETIDPDMPECLYDQPPVINSEFTLKSYQLLGISWLNLLYSQNLSGILADEVCLL